MADLRKELDKAFGAKFRGAKFDSGEGRYVEVIPTGLAPVDSALGGGVGKGRISEWFGNESTGKTMLLLQLLANVQQRGGLAVLGDTEGAFDSWMFEQLDGNPETLILIPEERCDTIEAMFDFQKWFLDEMAKRKADGDETEAVLGWDSTAGTASRHLMKTGMDKADMSVPRAMSQGMKLVQGRVKRTNVALVYINQVREKMDSQDSSLHTPGGRAVKFHASTRLSLKFDGGSRTSQIKDAWGKSKDEAKHAEDIGRWTEGRVVKNRLTSPQQTFRLPIYTVNDWEHPVWGTPTQVGIDPVEAIWDYYLNGRFFAPGFEEKKERVIKQSGSWYQVHESLHPDGKKFHAKDWPRILEEVPRLRTLIYEEEEETE